MPLELAIIGGGFSGLTLSYFLKKFSIPGSINVSLFEAKSNLGGWIQTTNVDDYGKKGSVFNFGPKTIRISNSKSHALIYLLNDLKIKDKILIADTTSSSSKKRYIFHQNQILTANLMSILVGKISPFTWTELIRIFLRDLQRRPLPEADLSVHEFFARYISTNFSDRIVDPVMIGIYARSARELSMQFCMNSLWNKMKSSERMTSTFYKQLYTLDCACSEPSIAEKLKTAISTLPPNGRMLGFEGGLSTMVEGLQKLFLQEEFRINVHDNVPIKKIYLEMKNGISRPCLKSNESVWELDHVFSTVPAFKLAPLLGHGSNNLKDLLNKCKYTSIVTISLEFDNKDCCNFVEYPGFGVLVPTAEKQLAPLLGIIFDSNIFPKTHSSSNTTQFTALLGGTHFNSYFEEHELASTDIMIKSVLEVVKNYLKIDANPLRICSRVLKDSIVFPELNHSELVQTIQNNSRTIPLTISGSFVTGVSLPDIAHNNLELSINFLRQRNLFRIPE